MNYCLGQMSKEKVVASLKISRNSHRKPVKPQNPLKVRKSEAFTNF